MRLVDRYAVAKNACSASEAQNAHWHSTFQCSIPVTRLTARARGLATRTPRWSLGLGLRTFVTRHRRPTAAGAILCTQNRSISSRNSGKFHGISKRGLLLEFASVVDAVRCAVEAQREMAERNADVPPNRRIELRMGISPIAPRRQRAGRSKTRRWRCPTSPRSQCCRSRI
jgi:hypothetical protein